MAAFAIQPQQSFQWPHRHIYQENPTSAHPALPKHSEVELTRPLLLSILNYFSLLLPTYFPQLPIRLVVHGGACMLLHSGLHALSSRLLPGMPRRTTTRDVDYIRRNFQGEMLAKGVPDAVERLGQCILLTARKFGLGEDWMNADADVALPMAVEPNTMSTYDPICVPSLAPNNTELHTIFRSDNGALTLVSVTPFWAVALKLVRYTKFDPVDICLLLRYGTVLSSTEWTTDTLERWLLQHCWSMGYANYDARRRQEMKVRIQHAVQMVNGWEASAVSEPVPVPVPSGAPHVTALSAMGGDETVAVSNIREWMTSFSIADAGHEDDRPSRKKTKKRSKSRNKSRNPSRNPVTSNFQSQGAPPSQLDSGPELLEPLDLDIHFSILDKYYSRSRSKSRNRSKSRGRSMSKMIIRNLRNLPPSSQTSLVDDAGWAFIDGVWVNTGTGNDAAKSGHGAPRDVHNNHAPSRFVQQHPTHQSSWNERDLAHMPSVEVFDENLSSMFYGTDPFMVPPEFDHCRRGYEKGKWRQDPLPPKSSRKNSDRRRKERRRDVDPNREQARARNNVLHDMLDRPRPNYSDSDEDSEDNSDDDGALNASHPAGGWSIYSSPSHQLRQPTSRHPHQLAQHNHQLELLQSGMQLAPSYGNQQQQQQQQHQQQQQQDHQHQQHQLYRNSLGLY